MTRWMAVICTVSLILASTSALAAECDDEVLIVEEALAWEAEQLEPQNLEMATELFDEAVQSCDSYNFSEDQDVGHDGNQHALMLLALASNALNIFE